MNSSPDNNDTVLGLPVTKFTLVCYVLILASAGFGVLSSLLVLVNMGIPYGGIFLLLGFLGVALSVTGFIVFSEKFNETDISHFKFIGVVFIAFFLIYIIFSNALAGFGVVGSILTLIIAVAEFTVLFAGYRVWNAGHLATVDTIKTQLNILKSQIAKKDPAKKDISDSDEV